MTEEKEMVAIDTDFFLKLTEKTGNGDLFIKVMDELNVRPVMHEYICNEELYGNVVAKSLIENGYIKEIKYEQFLSADKKEGYESSFRTAYKYFNFEEFKGNVYEDKRKKKNLGEIRTALMAVHMGIGVFMSDDGTAKVYVRDRINSKRHPLIVKGIYDVFMEIAQKKERKIKWADIKGCAKNAFVGRMKLYNDVKDRWHE